MAWNPARSAKFALANYIAGVEVTKDPIFLDISAQGVATRMVPWFLLGFLTVLQTTYNGTVHRALARTIGIILGSFFGWAGLKWSGSNLAGLIAFCSVTVFVDIFIFADPDHPLDGFHKGWGYSGMVFTYTQALIVTLATEDLGGLTGRCELNCRRLNLSMHGELLPRTWHPPSLANTVCTHCSALSAEGADVLQWGPICRCPATCLNKDAICWFCR